MLIKNTSGSPLYRITIDVQSFNGVEISPDLIEGDVSIDLQNVVLKSINSMMQGRRDDVVEIKCFSDSASISLTKKSSQPGEKKTGSGSASAGQSEV